jgi:hypothetical protein
LCRKLSCETKTINVLEKSELGKAVRSEARDSRLLGEEQHLFQGLLNLGEFWGINQKEFSGIRKISSHSWNGEKRKDVG